MNHLQNNFAPYLSLVESEIRKIKTYQDVPFFYDPIYYMMDLPGKKIRPLILLLSCGICGGELQKAVYAAAAVELLHNFTLVHDDIMDNDETRRGKLTIHVKWDVNAAILAGDGLLGFAFQKLLQTPSANKMLMTERFTEAMIIICEGQGLDKAFEKSEDITSAGYLDMIERKTAALIRLSCELGALAADATPAEVRLLYDFGHNLGMGFQLQDDILDVVGDQAKLGKKVGSDFEMHKQTILSIKLKEKIGSSKFQSLNLSDYSAALKSEAVLDEILSLTDSFFNKALKSLETLSDNEHKRILLEYTRQIQRRSY